MTKTHEPVARGKMQPKPGTPPGIELDGHGNVIPLAQRTKDDQDKTKGGSVKNPQNEAQNPSPMQRDQQGEGGRGLDNDPAGQQGGQR